MDPADRRIGRWRDLHQVKSSFAGDFERLKRLHDAELSSIFVDYADFAGANALIGADKTLVDTFLRGVARLGTARLGESIAWVLSRSCDDPASCKLQLFAPLKNLYGARQTLLSDALDRRADPLIRTVMAPQVQLQIVVS